MIKLTFLCFLTAATLGASAQQKIKDGTGTPVTSLPALGSILELQSTQAGLRMPQVALTSTIVWLPMLGSGAAATSPGMTVYNTNSLVSGSVIYPATGIGEYYWDGTGWVTKNAAISKTEFLQAVTSGGTQSVSTINTDINFAGTTLASSTPSGSISVTANTVTLQPGKTYLLRFNTGQIFCSAGNGFFRYRWFNQTNSTFVGVGGLAYAVSATGTSTGASSGIQTNINFAEAIISPAVVTTLSVRTTSGSPAVLSVGNAAGVIETSPGVTVYTIN